MNGTKSPDAASANNNDIANSITNDAGTTVSAVVDDAGANNKTTNDDGESEAETLIDSPVKKKEAVKINENAVKHNMEMKQEEDVANLESAELEDEADAPGSPIDDDEEIRVKHDDDDAEHSSDQLSDVSEHEDSPSSSRASSRSRAVSELPNSSHTSPNPRKRKHRASSVSLPNKRRSVESARRRLRTAAVDEPDAADNDRSDSPRSRTHRRAVSTQSFLDGNNETGSSRKRRAAIAISSRDAKQARWEESSVSSEATSHGQGEQKRQRGIGRSTIGVGRPVGREHKRHVNKYGFTRLAEACEAGDVQLAKEWREKDPEQLEIAEFAGNKPLQIAALNGNAEVVEYLISEGCQVDCANVDKDTPLIDAAENGHIDVVRILLKAGVDPLRQNLKGQQALDVVADDTDNATEIRAALRNAIETWNSVDAKQRREEEEVQRYRAGPAKELHFMARTYENLLRLVTINDRNGVREFLDARVPVDNAVIAAAAKTGDLYLMNMLLAEMTDKKRAQKAEKPMLSVIGTSHFEMVKSLTELDQFNPLWTNRQGKRWSEIAEERAGPMWRQEVELLQQLEREAQKKQVDRRSSSPIMRRSDASNGKHKRSVEKADDHEDSDEEVAGEDDENTSRRKGGRRLLSRKDMQAASKRGDKDQPASGSEIEDDSDGVAQTLAPSPKRGPGRPPRNKSLTVKHEETNKDSVNKSDSRRRSSTSKQVNAPSDGSPSAEINLNEQASSKAEAQRKKQQEEMLQKRKAEQMAEAAQKRAEQEEALKQILQQRKEAEEAERQRVAAEEEREEQRRLEQAALDHARSKTRQQLLDVLPQTLSWFLDPMSDFSYDEVGAAATILEACGPLEVVYSSDFESADISTQPSEPLVLNTTIAPLLGKGIGLQLLLPDDAMDPSVRETLLAQGILPGQQISEAVRAHLDQLLYDSKLLMQFERHEEHMVNGINGDDFEEELRQQAVSHMARRTASRQLSGAPVALRWLPLQQVFDRFHPSLHNHDVKIKEQWRNVLGTTSLEKSASSEDFFAQVCRHWEHSGNAYTCRYSEQVTSKRMGSHPGWTSVDTVRGK